MPFLFKRIRENSFLFFLVGIIYYVVYHKLANAPNTGETILVSCMGFLAVGAIFYCIYLKSYLMSFEAINIYMKTNLLAYLGYVLIFYVIYALDALVGGGIYELLFAPYDMLIVFGLGRLMSTVVVHILFMAVTFLLPYFVRRHDFMKFFGFYY